MTIPMISNPQSELTSVADFNSTLMPDSVLVPNPIPFLAAKGYAHMSAWVDALQRAMPNEQILAFDTLSEQQKASVTVAIVANPDPAELRQMPQLQWVHSVWAGVERLLAELDGDALKIVRLIDPQLAQTMAEAVLSWTLYLHRDMPAYARQQKQHHWQALEYVRPQAKTVSLLGVGALGSASAVRLLDAGFQVCAWSRTEKNMAGVQCYSGMDGLREMLARSDILVCLLPLTPATRGLLDAEQLSYLPAGASLINFARGAIINDQDLKNALDTGHLKHAVLDVFETEPLPVREWPWDHPAVTVLPHCTAPTERSTAAIIVAENILKYRNSGQIPRCVDSVLGY